MPDQTDNPPHMDDALDWFVRLQDGETSADDRRAFDAWFSADPAHEQAYRAIQGMWEAKAFADAVSRAEVRLDAPAKQTRSVWRPMALAASILIALGATALVTDAPIRLAADHLAETGEQKRITLADGSNVLLNTGSAIAVDMSGTTRNVRLLKGEAFFEVVPDASRPFHVRGGGADVRVVGTAFAVRLNKDATIVTVREGRVQVSGAETSVMLNPGQQTRLGATGLNEPYLANMMGSLAWTEERLIFEDRTLGEIADEIGRYHPGVIVFASERLRGIRVGGNYRLNDPVAALAAMAQIANAELVRLSDYVLILR